MDTDIEYKVKAKKQFGQHFLTSQKAIDDIVNCLTTPSNSLNLPPLRIEGEFPTLVIEIGPGTGVLTRSLLEKGFTVLAIEIDKESIVFLQENFAEYIKNKKLFIIEKDCLGVDFGELALEYTKQEKYYLVGNIPYYITGAIFRNSFVSKNLPEKVVYLVQKEVAERVVANDKKESILSMSIKIYGIPKKIATVKAGSFNPPPKVDSAILEIQPHPSPLLGKGEGTEQLFFKIIKTAFLHKRKYALANLKKYLLETNEIDQDLWEKVKENISEKERAEDIPLNVWINILNN
jgi:16S rRNA (adenine1518-N6/adenine1519-N6)-dimethyltransferase